MLLEILPGIRPFSLHDLFWFAADDYFAAGVAAAWAEVDYVVCGFYYIQVMLYDQDCILCLYKSVQYIEELFNVSKVQACCGLIKYIESPSCPDLAKFCGKLHSLRLAAGKRSSRLAHFNIAKAHIIEYL